MDDVRMNAMYTESTLTEMVPSRYVQELIQEIQRLREREQTLTKTIASPRKGKQRLRHLIGAKDQYVRYPAAACGTRIGFYSAYRTTKLEETTCPACRAKGTP